VHTGGGSHAGCHVYPHRQPILYVTTEEFHLTLTSAVRRESGRVDEADLTFARALVKAAGTYLADTERLFALQNPRVDNHAEPPTRNTAA
jgi:hypothetical protein